MELLTGRDLESLVRQFGPVQPERAKYLLQQVCHTLAEAHERGLIHRDVKPANIYACRMGLDYDFVKVLDFGLVKFDAAHHVQAKVQTVMMTGVHTTLGTPGYMAPEVILGNGAVDARADVYAVGCVAYFLLTGQPVFQGSTPMEMLVAHVHTPPMPPSQRGGLRVPPEIDASVLPCLEKDPDRRPEDATALLRMIDDWTTDVWSTASARDWWQRHLHELTGRLASIDGTGLPSSPSTVAAAARMPTGKGGPRSFDRI
jgi:eukaryotic-like serine/threonine-protein kinase